MIETLLIIIAALVLFLITLALTGALREVERDDENDNDIDAEFEVKKKQLSMVNKHLDNRIRARHAKVMDTLEWMLVNGIITPDEYNKLLMKSLPFLHG